MVIREIQLVKTHHVFAGCFLGKVIVCFQWDLNYEWYLVVSPNLWTTNSSNSNLKACHVSSISIDDPIDIGKSIPGNPSSSLDPSLPIGNKPRDWNLPCTSKTINKNSSLILLILNHWKTKGLNIPFMLVGLPGIRLLILNIYIYTYILWISMFKNSRKLTDPNYLSSGILLVWMKQKRICELIASVIIMIFHCSYKTYWKYPSNMYTNMYTCN